MRGGKTLNDFSDIVHFYYSSKIQRLDSRRWFTDAIENYVNEKNSYVFRIFEWGHIMHVPIYDCFQWAYSYLHKHVAPVYMSNPPHITENNTHRAAGPASDDTGWNRTSRADSKGAELRRSLVWFLISGWIIIIIMNAAKRNQAEILGGIWLQEVNISHVMFTMIDTR